jgi:hypothetical protein
LYVSYVPAEVEEKQVRAQLDAMEKHVHLFAPDCILEQSELIFA